MSGFSNRILYGDPRISIACPKDLSEVLNPDLTPAEGWYDLPVSSEEGVRITGRFDIDESVDIPQSKFEVFRRELLRADIAGRQSDVVRAVFTPGGQEYNYVCKGAEVGDLIRGPNTTGPAIVVALGSNGYPGPYKIAELIQKRGRMNKDFAKKNNTRTISIVVPADEDPVKSLKRALKQARKEQDKQRKAQAKINAERAEKERLRGVAIQALESQADLGDTQAAIALYDLNH